MLSLLALAKKQKRDFCLIEFSSTGQLKTTIFPKGASTPETVMEAVTHFYGRGTDFTPMMRKAQELIRSAEWERAESPGPIFTEGAGISA